MHRSSIKSRLSGVSGVLSHDPWLRLANLELNGLRGLFSIKFDAALFMWIFGFDSDRPNPEFDWDALKPNPLDFVLLQELW